MQIKDPGMFSRGKITIAPSPHVTPDTLMADLQQAWGAQGFEVYKTALIGADLVLKKSAWTGIAIGVKHSPQSTVITWNAFSPSFFVRLLAMGAIPLLIVYYKSWKPLMEQFKQYAHGSALLNGGQMHAGHMPAGQMMPGQAQGYPQQPPQQGYPQQQPQQGYPQQPPQQGYPQQQPQQGYPQQQQQPQQGYPQQQQQGYPPPGYPPQGGGQQQ